MKLYSKKLNFFFICVVQQSLISIMFDIIIDLNDVHISIEYMIWLD